MPAVLKKLYLLGVDAIMSKRGVPVVEVDGGGNEIARVEDTMPGKNKLSACMSDFGENVVQLI